MSTAALELTIDEKQEVFKIATSAFKKRYKNQIDKGMTDPELECALKEILGIFGGSCGPDKLSVTYQAAGLKIWGSWEIINPYKIPPLFSGIKTIKMAREIYRIQNRDDNQLALL